MKRELTFLAMVVALSSLAIGGEPPKDNDVPRFKAIAAVLAAVEGVDVGRWKAKGLFFYPGALGTVGYGVSVEPELEPTKELLDLLQSRWQELPESPSGKLSMDRENRSVVYTGGNQYRRLPLDVDEMKYALFISPREELAFSWSIKVDSPSSRDLLLQVLEIDGLAKLVVFTVDQENADRWQVASVPISNAPIKHDQLGDQKGFGLYRQGDQLVLFLPLERGDQAWEVHLPETLEESVRFHVFPITERFEK